tara:strand:+ start:12686 stop:13192 length:507 start_codon:yes stop_codon:yes gene_type:complete
MKKILFTLATAVFFLTSCEGPQGPPGPQGLDGGLYFAQTFEDNVNFQFNNDTGWLDAIIPIPTNIEVFESDAVLVYLLEGQLSNGDDLWSLIPQNFFLSGDRIVQYRYNHTFYDVLVTIDGNFDVSTLGPAFTQNQIFRVVVVPAEFATESGVDVQDYNAVMEALNLD